MWILLSDGEAVVKSGGSPVHIIVRNGLYPTIVCNGSHFYPRSWHGFICHDGEIVKWEFPSGPIREIKIQTDSEGQRWVLVVWK